VPQHFYVNVPEPELILDSSFELDSDRSHYVSRVLRKRTGDVCDCFDGRGLRFRAQVHAQKHQTLLTITEILEREPRPETRNHLGLALLKGGAMDRAIQLACESGADDISLFTAFRSNARMDAQRLASKLAHWQKVIVAAGEQSGRSHLPHFEPSSDLQQLIADHTNAYVLDMEGGPLNYHVGADRLLLIGPEGGWSDDERRLFDQERVQRVSLGPTTLRAESTPGAAMAILNYLANS
jgi:16S rRNA (uracil1498-N3)-methyltransferase